MHDEDVGTHRDLLGIHENQRLDGARPVCESNGKDLPRYHEVLSSGRPRVVSRPARLTLFENQLQLGCRDLACGMLNSIFEDHAEERRAGPGELMHIRGNLANHRQIQREI